MTDAGNASARTIHRDLTRFVESEPQTQHKIEFIGTYYGQHPEILIAAAQRNPRIDASHIWLVEACAGAGTYASAEHPDGFVDGCAIQACKRAREIQRRHPSVTMHVVLIEANAGHCASLGTLIREFTDASGRDCVDVRIEPGRFEDRVDVVLYLIRKADGSYYHSLWFIDPDGLVEIPHEAIERICVVGRGPEVIVNLSASGLARLATAANAPSASALGQRARMNGLWQ